MRWSSSISTLLTPPMFTHLLICCREKDVFYYEMEFRRLEWKKSRVDAAKGPFGGRSKELERAQQALDVSSLYPPPVPPSRQQHVCLGECKSLPSPHY